jgi:hypothetical protein
LAIFGQLAARAIAALRVRRKKGLFQDYRDLELEVRLDGSAPEHLVVTARRPLTGESVSTGVSADGTFAVVAKNFEMLGSIGGAGPMPVLELHTLRERREHADGVELIERVSGEPVLMEDRHSVSQPSKHLAEIVCSDLRRALEPAPRTIDDARRIVSAARANLKRDPLGVCADLDRIIARFAPRLEAPAAALLTETRASFPEVIESRRRGEALRLEREVLKPLHACIAALEGSEPSVSLMISNGRLKVLGEEGGDGFVRDAGPIAEVAPASIKRLNEALGQLRARGVRYRSIMILPDAGVTLRGRDAAGRAVLIPV